MSANGSRQEIGHLPRHGAEPDHIVDLKRLLGEPPDSENRPDEGERRDDRVDAGAVRKPGVDHGGRLVHAPAERGDDLIDDPHHVLLIVEGHVGELELAETLDEDLVVAVDHDLGNALVVEERLDRPEAGDLVEDVVQNPHVIDAGRLHAVLGQRLVQHRDHL